MFSGCGFGSFQGRALGELVKRFAKLLQGAMDARSDGVEFAAEKRGNFFVL